MKSVVLCFLAVLLLGFVQSACAEEISTEKAGFDRMMKTGVLRCGYAPAPPYFVKDPNTGEMSGPVYEIVNEIGKRMDVKIEWAVEASFGTAVADLQAGKYDMFCVGLVQTGVRGKYVDFTAAPFYTLFDLWVKDDDHRFDNNISSLNDSGIKMAVIEGSALPAIRRQMFPLAQETAVVSLGEDNSDIMMSVASGKADFTVADRHVGEKFIASNPGSIRRLNTKVFRVVPWSFGVAKGDRNLQQAINSALIDMQASGGLAQILDSFHDRLPNLFPPPPLAAVPQE